MQYTNGLTCYQCGKDDMIQNVPAVVAGGTAQGDFSGPSGGLTFIDGKTGYTSGYSHLSGTMTSDLARALAAPASPNKLGFWSFVGWSCIFYLSILIIIGPFLVWPRFKEAITTDPEEQKRIFTPGLKFGTIIVLILGWHPMVWPFIPLLKKKIYERFDYPQHYAEWRSIYRRWQNLYYCHRCGIVCDPSTHASMTPRYMESFLYTNDPAYTIQRESKQTTIPELATRQQNTENIVNVVAATNIPLSNNPPLYQTAQEQISVPDPRPDVVPPISSPTPVKNDPIPEKRISLGLENLFQDDNDLPKNSAGQETSSEKKWKEIDL